LRRLRGRPASRHPPGLLFLWRRESAAMKADSLVRGQPGRISSAFVRPIRTTSTRITKLIIFLLRDKPPSPASEAIYRSENRLDFDRAYSDARISGAKGRGQRPAFDKLCDPERLAGRPRRHSQDRDQVRRRDRHGPADRRRDGGVGSAAQPGAWRGYCISDPINLHRRVPPGTRLCNAIGATPGTGY
jgi:hypothetical protein